MKLNKEIEIELYHADIDVIMSDASPLDKLSLIIRLAKTISPKDIKEIAELMGIELRISAIPLKLLSDTIYS